MIPRNDSPLAHSRLSRFTKYGDKSIGAIAVACVTALGFASAYLQQFFLPSVPLTPWGDQVMWLGNGERILDGRMPYRDYFQFTTPGCDAFYALLIRIWGSRAWIPNLTMAVIAALATLLIVLIARRLLPGFAALAPALLFIGFALPSSLYATHHWFTTLGVLGAVFGLLEEVTLGRAAVAGVLCGVAGFFTQTKAAIIGLAIVAFFFSRARTPELRKKAWANSGIFFASAAVVFAAENAFFIRAAGLVKFIFWTILFPLRYFSAGKPFNTIRTYGSGLGRNMGVLHTAGFLFVHALIPLVYIVFFIQFFRRRIKSEKSDGLFLVALVGTVLFIAIAPAPSPLRIFTISPFALILFAGVAGKSKLMNCVVKLSAATAFLVAILIPIRFQTHWHAFLDTPSGRIAFIDRDRLEEFQWAKKETHPGEMFFGNAPVCFALGLRNPTPLDYTTTDDFTRPALVAQLVQELEVHRVGLMLLLPGEYLSQGNDKVGDHTTPFREYLFKNYELGKRFATGDEAWTRRTVDTESAAAPSAILNSRESASNPPRSR